MIGIKEIRTAVELLNHYVEAADRIGFDEGQIETLTGAAAILKDELEHEVDQLAHSEVTIEMEQGEEIPLTQWAAKNGLTDSYARAKARRGKFKTARRIGRDWVINEFEENIDHRTKGRSERWNNKEAD